MKSCAVTTAGSALIFAVFAITGPLPPAVNTAVEISQHLIVRETPALSSGSSIPYNTVSHAGEGAIAARSPIPSGHDPGALEDAYKMLTPAEIVAYNNLGPVIPSEPLPPVLSSAIVSSDPPPPEFSSGPAIGNESAAEIVDTEIPDSIIPGNPLPPKSSSNSQQAGTGIVIGARSVMALGIVEVGDSLQVQVPQAVLGTSKPRSRTGLDAGTSHSATTEGAGDAGSRTLSSQFPAIFEGRSSRRYVPVGVMSALLAVAVAFVMM
ncbi:uncharacterized protein H6S33_005324 [Morchella sextelata]|uniref:uncharacterized protein n=1 Tax=Morchella sextelata TaxID=1174677 RepID=UPI001D040D3E|nr:uncharacterized protein H6S33_005324 [Morchella sextelata]KAH0613438.1 hypothetical protein H6S33_005324 [Morchella sextelata]